MTIFDEESKPKYAPGFTRLMTGSQILAAMTSELRAVPEPMVVAFQPVAMFQIAGLLQIALRHPTVAVEVREAGDRFLRDIHEYFGACPTVRDVLTRTNDPKDQGF